MKKPRINIVVDAIGEHGLLAKEALVKRLDELLEHFEIGHAEISGGETLSLPQDYLFTIKRTLLEREIDDIVVLTDLLYLTEAAHDEDLTLSVKYDFLDVDSSNKVFENIVLLSRPFFLVTAVCDDVLDRLTPDDYVNTLSALSLLWHAEIKPIGFDGDRDRPKSFKRVEEFIWQVIKHPARTFTLENEWQLDRVVKGELKWTKEDYVYVTPSGDLAVLELDEKGREYSKELDDVYDYLKWRDLKKVSVPTNATCGGCSYYEKCLSERTREMVAIDGSCNGLRNLIEKWEKEP